MESWQDLKIFWDYLESYPDEDEPGFDGVHYGGIKGVKADSPEHVKKAFSDYQKRQQEAIKLGLKV